MCDDLLTSFFADIPSLITNRMSNLHHEAGLLCELLLDEDLLSAFDVLGLHTHNTSTPFGLDVVEGGLEGFAENFEILLVLLADGGDARSGAGLLSDELSESGLGLDDAERHVFLAAESRQPADELDRIDIMSDDDELGLLLLNQISDVVETELDDARSLSLDVLLVGFVSETLLLFSLSLRSQLLQQSRKLRELGLVAGVLELRDRRRDLEALQQDALLALEADVLRPFDETSQVSLRLDITSNTEVASTLLEDWALLHLRGSVLGRQRSSWHLLLRLGSLLSLQLFLRHL